MTSATTHDAVARYVEFWNTEPGDGQRELATHVFGPTVRYRAPLGERDGIDGLLALAREFDEQLGELTMTARRAPDVHHGRARIAWRLDRHGAFFAEGTDVLTFDDGGAVVEVVTFIDTPPAGADLHAHHGPRSRAA